MSDNTTIWIVAAVIVALVVIVGLAIVARSKRTQSRREEAARLRTELDAEDARVQKRQALAKETEARARAAEAEAEAKAAEASRLRDRASTHHESVATAREDLTDRRKHVDHIDPDVKVGKHENRDAADVDGKHREAGPADRQVVTERSAAVENPR